MCISKQLPQFCGENFHRQEYFPLYLNHFTLNRDGGEGGGGGGGEGGATVKRKVFAAEGTYSIYGPCQMKRCLQTCAKCTKSDSSRACSKSHPGICSPLAATLCACSISL